MLKLILNKMQPETDDFWPEVAKCLKAMPLKYKLKFALRFLRSPTGTWAYLVKYCDRITALYTSAAA